MHVAQVSGFLDPEGRSPEELLEAWPSLVDVADAAVGADVRVSVFQAAACDAEIERGRVVYHFVAGGAGGPSASGERGAVPHAGGGPRRLPWILARRVALARPDIVHVHGLGFPLHVRLLARYCGSPVLVQDHADPLPPPWLRPYHRWGLAGADAFAFTAGEQALPFVEAGVLPSGAPIHEIVESSSRFHPGDVVAARAETGIGGDPCLVWIGRLDENKDPLTALEGVRRSARKLPDLRLWCCFTEAPLLDAVQRRVETDPTLRSRVRLLGRVPHRRVELLLRAADLYVSTSHREGSGFALIEALACGTTPVVTDIPSFRRITGGRVGALVPRGSPDAVAEAILRLARRDRARARLEVRTHFEEHVSFSALGRELRRAYGAMRGKA